MVCLSGLSLDRNVFHHGAVIIVGHVWELVVQVAPDFVPQLSFKLRRSTWLGECLDSSRLLNHAPAHLVVGLTEHLMVNEGFQSVGLIGLDVPLDNVGQLVRRYELQ